MSKPAARMGDMTAHGGTISVGFPTVLIGGQPAARMGDMHVCPMVTPAPAPVPHVGGPITLGSPTVLIGGMPAARMGDMLTCVGPPDTIALGCPTVLIGEGAGGGGGGAGGAGAGAGAQSAAASLMVAGGAERGATLEAGPWLAAAFEDAKGRSVQSPSARLTLPQAAEGAAGEPTEEQTALWGKPTLWRTRLGEGDGEAGLRWLGTPAWSAEEAQVGEEVTLTCEAVGHEDGEEATVLILQLTADGDEAAVHAETVAVSGGQVEWAWTYAYEAEAYEARRGAGLSAQQAMPVYLARVVLGGDFVDSAELRYRASLRFVLEDEETGKRLPNTTCVIISATERFTCTSDADGVVSKDNVPPGTIQVVLG